MDISLGDVMVLLIVLVLFAVVDYLTGIMCAVADQKLSSHVGFKGICRKVLIFYWLASPTSLMCRSLVREV